MSAYIVNVADIDYLVYAALHYGYGQSGYVYYGNWGVTLDTADWLGAALLKQNVAMAEYRFLPVSTLDPAAYRYRPDGLPPLVPVKVLVTISRYEYQFCKYPTWERSAAHDFCTQLRTAAIRQLPGYHEAQTWSVERPDHPRREM